MSCCELLSKISVERTLTSPEVWWIPFISKHDAVSIVPRRQCLNQFAGTIAVSQRAARSFVVARGNALLQSLFAGPMVLIKDPLHDRPKVVEPLKVAQEILQVC